MRACRVTNHARLLDETEALLAAVEPTRWCPHEPHPKQAEFLASTEPDVLYGGAAGGGKSDALLMAALQYVDVPGHSALLIRRTFKDLNKPGAIMDRAQTWLRGTAAVWSERDKRFTFPSGAVLQFGYLDHERDLDQYQSAEFQFVGIDELTHFPEKWPRYLFSRLRRPKEGPLSKVPLRFRAGSNPGGIGHEWVHRKYIDKESATARFIPAQLADNPSLDQDEYRASLSHLDETTRKQLEDGLWVRDDGGLVYRYDRARNHAVLVPDDTWRYLLAEDYGFTDALAKVVWGWRPHDPVAYVVHAEKHERMTPTESAVRTRELEELYQFLAIVGDIGGLGKGYVEEARRRYGLPIEAADKNNKAGYQRLFNDALTEARIKVLPGCEALTSEWLVLPWADPGRSKEAEGFENHASDAALYGWRRVTSYLAKPAEVRRAPTPEQAMAADEERVIAEESRTSKRGRTGWLNKLARRQS